MSTTLASTFLQSTRLLVRKRTKQEERARKLQQLSFVRSDELATLLEEAEDFKLHEYTTANDMYLRHPGLYVFFVCVCYSPMIAGRVVLLFCVFHWAHKSCCLLVM